MHIYVGRTGDSSSPHASSPFNRIGQHLDFRDTAKGNFLAKRLKEANVNPKKSTFKMLALGPLFLEQKTFELHVPFRDQMATFEYELANYLRDEGYSVLGAHHKGSSAEEPALSSVKESALVFLQNGNS